MIAAADGMPLLMRHVLPSGRRTVFSAVIGHGPTVHSGHMTGLAEALAQQGIACLAGDLRGHGGSVTERQPLAHLDPDTGWSDWLEDMTALARVAFRGVPRKDRVLIGGAMSGHLMTQMLHRDPDLAGNLVMAAPIPPQPGLRALVMAFLRFRRMTHPLDRPDPQIQHHLYGFLRAHLPPGSQNQDTISADPDTVARVLQDPRGFPTPTLGYWIAMLQGMDAIWTDIGPGEMPADLRVLILSGPDDPQTRGGRLSGRLRDWWHSRGVADVTLRSIEGVRANILIDAPRLPVAPAITEWLSGTSDATPLPQDDAVPYQTALARLGVSVGDPVSIPALIDLCYAALEDDERWVELLYRLLLSSDADPAGMDALMQTVQPHWQRAFELREELRQAAAMGRLYHELIDRMAVGVAVLDADFALRDWNSAFAGAVATLSGQPLERLDLQRAVARILAAGPAGGRDGRRACDEVPVMHEGHVVGVLLQPVGLTAMAGGMAPPGRLLVLRAPETRGADRQHRAGLLSLAYGLTGQEATVAVHLAEGMTTEAIAQAMGVGDATVRSHIKRTFDKMGVSSRPELIHRVMSGPLGWLMGEDRARDASPPRLR
ncbi:alpha-beta hydrolase superfamily lysophospholipase [Roseicyclus mahoneyensis]|uniref:Alpha-beta hydrolase superfamily lysophospholipase n=2 Tax=Roseicyclus mahoneyensis TaxID=164332 RepID=A0A316H5T8_9RHOB|nr:alpha-beta hydrolase superfamily lysophospholipase [Roseicyclus mahoneyensis]